MTDKKLSLLDDSSDSEIDFQINKDYAQRYEKWRHSEELQKLKDKYGDDVSTSSSESEEEEEPVIEKDFLKTLSLLKGKDPQIYDESQTFFKDMPKTEKKLKERTAKPIYMKDLERKIILENNGEISDDDEPPKSQPSTSFYDKEQEEIKASFKSAVQDSDSDNDDFLQVRNKDSAEVANEQEDYIQWLKGKKVETVDDSSTKDMKFLRDYWNDPQLESGEKFLKDYILNKKYVDDTDVTTIPTYEDITHDVGTLSDDEELLEKQATFEHKYNFRFEEPDEEFIKHYPRTIGDSLRRKDNKRKLKREDYIERKKQEKEQKREEIKRLKSLKRKEIEEKINKLKEVTGNDTLFFDNLDLEDDFDPKEHDKKMREMFNNDYYEVEESDKPQFEPDDELDNENWDEWTGEDNQEYNEPHCDDPGFVMDADYNPKLEFQKQMVESTKSRKSRKKSKVAAAITRKKPSFNPDEKTFEQYFSEYYKLDCEDIIGDLPVRYKYREVVPNDFGLSVGEILNARDKELNRWCSVKKTSQYRSHDAEIYDVHAFSLKSDNMDLKKKVFVSLYGDGDDQKKESNNSVLSNSKKKKRNKEDKGISNDQTADEVLNQIADESHNQTNDIHNQMEVEKKRKKKRKRTMMNEAASDELIVKQPDVSGELSETRNVCSTGPYKSEEMEKNSGPEVKKKQKKKKRKATEELTVGDKITETVKHSNSAKRFKPVESDDKRLNLPDSRLAAYGINPKKFKNRIKYSKKNKMQ